MYLPPDPDSLHNHLDRVNYIVYCQKHFELRNHPCPIGRGRTFINGKCRPIRFSQPTLSVPQQHQTALHLHDNIDTESDTESETEKNLSGDEETEFEMSSDSDLSDGD